MARSPIKHLIEKEGIASIFFVIVCMVLALKFSAGVGTSNQAPSVSHAVAPWIFGPFQILLLYLPPWLGAIVLPIIVIVGLLGLPWLVDFLGVKTGQRTFVVLYAMVMVLLMWFMVKEFWWVK